MVKKVEFEGELYDDPGPNMHFEPASSDPTANIHRSPVPVLNPDPRPVAETDLLVERPDLAPDTYTVVSAGDRIPLELVDYTRHDMTGFKEPVTPAV